MIENKIRALFFDERFSFFRTRRSDNFQTCIFRPLNRRNSDSAGRAVNQNRFAFLRFGFLKKRAIARRIRNKNARALFKRNIFRQFDEPDFLRTKQIRRKFPKSNLPYKLCRRL